MSRRAHKPDPGLRRQVETLAGFGAPEVDIAGVVDIYPKTLRKHYRHELDHGHVNARVAENLYRKALKCSPSPPVPLPSTLDIAASPMSEAPSPARKRLTWWPCLSAATATRKPSAAFVGFLWTGVNVHPEFGHR